MILWVRNAERAQMSSSGDSCGICWGSQPWRAHSPGEGLVKHRRGVSLRRGFPVSPCGISALRNPSACFRLPVVRWCLCSHASSRVADLPPSHCPRGPPRTLRVSDVPRHICSLLFRTSFLQNRNSILSAHGRSSKAFAVTFNPSSI